MNLNNFPFYRLTPFPSSDTFFKRGVALGTHTLLFPQDTYEVFSFAAESHSIALGKGPVDRFLSVDLSDAFEYDDKHKFHSGQFRGSYYNRGLFWKKLVDDINDN